MTASSCDLPIEAFSRFTNLPEMEKVWREHLPNLFGRAFEFQSCAAQYTRCRTYLNPQSWHKSFLCVCYEFDTAEESSAAHKPMLYGRAYLRGRSKSAFDVATERSGAKLLPELDMIVWHFPNDPQLPQLAELINTAQVLQYLPYASLPFSNAELVNDIRVQVVRYRPEQRCILRYDIRFGATNERCVLYAKVFADDNGERVFARIQQCYAVADRLGVHIAKPLGYSARMRAVWQAELGGKPLAIADDLRAESRTMKTIGHCLAKLHASDLPMHKAITREARLIDATKKSRKLEQMLPDVATQLSEIIHREEREYPSLPPVPQAIIHGDVHFGQFLTTPDGGLALFDFDEWTCGDPAQDLADLIVDPHVSLYGRDESDAGNVLSAGMAAALLDSYRRHAIWDIDDTVVAWHARIQLINKAYRSAIQLEPYWRQKVPRLIALASREIDLGAEVTIGRNS